MVSEGLLDVWSNFSELHHLLLLTVGLTRLRWLLLLIFALVGSTLLEVLLEHAVHLVKLMQGVLGRRPRCVAIRMGRSEDLVGVEGRRAARRRHLVDLLDPLNRVFLLGLEALVDLLEDLVFDLIVKAVLPGGFRDGAWRQVQINLVNDL